MSSVVTLYDVACNDPNKFWNPNTWKARYALGFKSIRYETVLIEHTEIEAVCKKIGAPPTGTKPDGSVTYTVLFMYDPSTKTAVADSLFPPGSRALQHALANAHLGSLSSLWQFALPAAHKILNPRSQDHFRRTRESEYFGGRKLEDVLPKGEARKVEWAKVKDGFGKVDAWLQKGKADGPYVMGNTVSFADLVIAAWMTWLKKIWDEESEEWRDIQTWHGGRCVALLESVKKYETSP